MLDVIGPNGLVLLILGAQILHSLGDGQPAALDVLAANPTRDGSGGALQGESRVLMNVLRIVPCTPELLHPRLCQNEVLGPLGECLMNSSPREGTGLPSAFSPPGNTGCDKALIMG